MTIYHIITIMSSKMKDYLKTFYEKHPEKKNESIKCDICDGEYKYYNKNNHYATQKHKRAEKEKNIGNDPHKTLLRRIDATYDKENECYKLPEYEEFNFNGYENDDDSFEKETYEKIEKEMIKFNKQIEKYTKGFKSMNDPRALTFMSELLFRHAMSLLNTSNEIRNQINEI